MHSRTGRIGQSRTSDPELEGQSPSGTCSHTGPTPDAIQFRQEDLFPILEIPVGAPPAPGATLKRRSSEAPNRRAGVPLDIEDLAVFSLELTKFRPLDDVVLDFLVEEAKKALYPAT